MTERTDKTKTTTQCHFISNTHWDREWRFSMQRTRHMLVYMMDMLLDIFEREPQFKSFHLDSQTVPIQDYLEIRPEKKETVAKLIEERSFWSVPGTVCRTNFRLGANHWSAISSWATKWPRIWAMSARQAIHRSGGGRSLRCRKYTRVSGLISLRSIAA